MHKWNNLEGIKSRARDRLALLRYFPREAALEIRMQRYQARRTVRAKLKRWFKSWCQPIAEGIG